jgi:hypothetical protein
MVDTGQDFGVYDLIFEVRMVVQMLMLVIWLATLCGLMGRYQGTSVLKVETLCFSEMLVSAYKFTCYCAEDQY